ncbi:hypothetical protein M0R89_20995 (plasmid) [Halorussus limi]|uniref:Uncharacterized protein n=1 Tax=Halorussus limi TaxID=2938695 RepID=A0A8U0I1B6_9EURY|nr:hypothetical protein [Halorussus limi]UPV76681.1 hypothetical protein M0R89_20995 [Halorussus limi]
MTASKWLFTALLVLQAHFAASYFVPLDREAQREFGGLLRWVWPWSGGDSGLLGQVTVSSGIPLSGIFLAGTAGVLFFLAALAVVEIRVPFGWWRMLAGGGATLSLLLMVGFFGTTKILPMVLDIVVLWAAITDWLQPTG